MDGIERAKERPPSLFRDAKGGAGSTPERRHLRRLLVVLAMVAAVAGGVITYLAQELALGKPFHPGELAIAVVAVGGCAYTGRRLMGALVRHIEEGEAGNRAVLETAADAIITIDARGLVRSFNKAAESIFGYSAGEVIGQNVKMLMPSPYREEHDDYLARYLTTGQKKIIGIGREVAARRKNGSIFPIELAVSEAHAGPLFTGIIRDVSERKELELSRETLIDELEQKNAELERFTYTVSHDLKSPLITISGFVGGLEGDARSGNFTRLHADVVRISAAVERMKRLLDELLHLSRVGRIVNAPTEISVRQVAMEVVSDLSGPLEQRGVEVVVSEDLPIVYGDRMRLHEVVQNLVENAIKFMGDQAAPRIEIGTKVSERERVIYVRDNGIGIDVRYRDKIFGLFDKLDQDSPGTGIGLALAKRVVELHGGRIWVESNAEGRGAEFCFSISDPRGRAVHTLGVTV